MGSKCLCERHTDLWTGRAEHGQGNTDARSWNRCCSGKALSVTYFEWVSVALGIQHETCMRHIAICALPRSTIFSHIISQTVRFSKRKLLNTKCVFWFSLNISHSKKNSAKYDRKMCIAVIMWSSGCYCQKCSENRLKVQWSEVMWGEVER